MLLKYCILPGFYGIQTGRTAVVCTSWRKVKALRFSDYSIRILIVLEVMVMKKIQIRCPYCGAKATLRPSSAVYGNAAKTDGYLYVCDRYPKCDAYVAAHRKSRLPMGTLANGDLRHKRIEAHKAFDWMWRSGLMSKRQAYRWMQAKLGLNEKQAHIAKFSEYMCDQLIAVCTQTQDNIRSAA